MRRKLRENAGLWPVGHAGQDQHLTTVRGGEARQPCGLGDTTVRCSFISRQTRGPSVAPLHYISYFSCPGPSQDHRPLLQTWFAQPTGSHLRAEKLAGPSSAGPVGHWPSESPNPGNQEHAKHALIKILPPPFIHFLHLYSVFHAGFIWFHLTWNCEI